MINLKNFGFGAFLNFEVKGLPSLTQAKRTVSDVNNGVNKLVNKGEDLTKLYQNMTMVGGGMVAGGAGVLKLLDNSEKSFAKIQTQQVQVRNRLRGTTEEYKELGRTITDVTRATRYTGEQGWDATKKLLSFGTASEKINKAFKQTVKLAIGTEETPTIAGKILAQAQNVSQEGYLALTNILTKSLHTTAIGADYGLEEFKYLNQNIAQIKELVNISYAGGTALFSMFRASGMSAMVAGQRIKMLANAVSSLARNEKAFSVMQKEAKQFGISLKFFNDDGTMKPFTNQVEQIFNYLNAITKQPDKLVKMLGAGQISTLEQMGITTPEGMAKEVATRMAISFAGSKREAQALLATIGKLNTEGSDYLTNLKNVLGISFGYNDKAVNRVNATLNEQREIMKGLLISAKEEIGKSLAGIYAKAFTSINTKLEKFSRFLGNNENLAKKISLYSGIGSVIFILVGGFMLLTGVIGLLSIQLAKTGGIFMLMKVGMLSFAKTLGILLLIVGALVVVVYMWQNWGNLSTHIKALTFALVPLLTYLLLFKKLNWILNLGNKFMFFIIAVSLAVGLGYYLYKEWKNVSKTFKVVTILVGTLASAFAIGFGIVKAGMIGLNILAFLSPLRIALIGMIATIGIVFYLYKNWNDISGTTKALLIALSTVLGTVSLAIMAVKIQVWAMNSAWLANPWTWVIAIAIGLIGSLVWYVAWLVKNWEKMFALWDDWKTFIDPFVMGVIAGIDLMSDAIKDFKELVIDNLDFISKAIKFHPLYWIIEGGGALKDMALGADSSMSNNTIDTNKYIPQADMDNILGKNNNKSEIVYNVNINGTGTTEADKQDIKSFLEDLIKNESRLVLER